MDSWMPRRSNPHFYRPTKSHQPPPSERPVALFDCLSWETTGWGGTNNEWFTHWTSMTGRWVISFSFFFLFFGGAIFVSSSGSVWCSDFFLSSQVEIPRKPGNSIQQFKRKPWRQKDSSRYVLRPTDHQTRKQTCLEQDIWKPVTWTSHTRVVGETSD